MSKDLGQGLPILVDHSRGRRQSCQVAPQVFAIGVFRDGENEEGSGLEPTD
jgi:hypothetical protein